MPTCRSCTRDHYNFQSCHDAARRALEAEQAEAKKRAKKVVPAYRGDGAQEWRGDRLDSFERAGNMFWRKRDA